MIRHDVDIAIVGSGFSGSLLAMIARRLGRSVVLLERGHHPRFAIGESSTPLASLLLEELAREYDLPRLIPLGKYGSWKRAYPGLGCGLKRGFSFFRHERGAPFAVHSDRRNQLLVAASPHDEIGDVHWYRPDFDHFFVREAINSGVTYVDGVELASFVAPGIGSVGDPAGRTAHRARLTGQRTSTGGQAERVDVVADLVVDATGPRGYLHRQLELGERKLPGMPATQALFTHLTGVRRFEDVAADAFAGAPPYPPDAAAVHHVFDGGWIWVLQFDNGITSAGVAATDELAGEVGLSDGAAAWDRLLARYPSIAAQFVGATPAREFTWLPRLSFASEAVSGDGWVMLPSAAGIVDPLLSTGFPLTLLGVQRVAGAIASHWGMPSLRAALADHGTRTAAELDNAARLVGALYRSFNDWERFSALSLLYFAAASYAESVRRLAATGQAGDASVGAPAGAFLMADHPVFGRALERCLALADGTDRAALLAAVAGAIAPINVAGLGDSRRANWYPCDANDLISAAPKLGVSEGEIRAMLDRCGFTPRPVSA